MAFVIFNGFYSFDDKTVPQLAENNFQPPAQIESPSTNASPSEQVAIANVQQNIESEKSIVEITKQKTEQAENKKQSKTSQSENLFVAVKSTRNSQDKNRKEDEENSGGSRVSSSRKLQVIMPEGISNSTQANRNSPNFASANPITVVEILSQLGIESVLENGSRKVKKITQNSVAQRSDVRVGDLVEAIDGEKLTSEPIRAKIIEGKKLTVVRGTEKVEIFLRY